jgi:hypothetical protein
MSRSQVGRVKTSVRLSKGEMIRMAMEVDSSPEREGEGEDRHRRVHWSSAVHNDGPWATGDGITTRQHESEMR